MLISNHLHNIFLKILLLITNYYIIMCNIYDYFKYNISTYYYINIHLKVKHTHLHIFKYKHFLQLYIINLLDNYLHIRLDLLYLLYILHLQNIQKYKSFYCQMNNISML